VPLMPPIETPTAIANVRQAKQLLSDAGVIVESYHVEISRDAKRLIITFAMPSLPPSHADDLIRYLLWPEKAPNNG
jgi:hypothetical protein